VSRSLRLGTRRSPLARAQAQLVADQLSASWSGEVELVEFTTQGDISSASLTQIGGTGVFVSALRDAVLAGAVDFAVHSLKDLPTVPDAELALAAVPTRADPRDALVAGAGMGLLDLPAGSTVGTGSPRRAAQLLGARPDLVVCDVRGNVGTRLAMVADRQLDAVVLAAAGLARLGRLAAVTELLDPAVMLPAPGQGALAVECRRDSQQVRGLLAALDDPAARAAVTAERALLAALGTGCSAPVGALAEPDPKDAGALLLRVAVAEPGGTVRRLSAVGPKADPVGLGERLARLSLAAVAGAPMGVRTP
jgi:hydroxymethylbilane synthase